MLTSVTCSGRSRRSSRAWRGLSTWDCLGWRRASCPPGNAGELHPGASTKPWCRDGQEAAMPWIGIFLGRQEKSRAANVDAPPNRNRTDPRAARLRRGDCTQVGVELKLVFEASQRIGDCELAPTWVCGFRERCRRSSCSKLALSRAASRGFRPAPTRRSERGISSALAEERPQPWLENNCHLLGN